MTKADPIGTEQTALGHVRVLDLSRVLAGPWATQLLGDLGAEIVKVEHPDRGDDTREWGPPFCRTGDETKTDAAYFTACNRNKRSVAIDFAKPGGAALVKRLAAASDVVVENYKVGGLARYGLDYASLGAADPSLVYCSVTGFGQTGPYAGRAGYDFLIQGMGGLMAITGHPDDAPSGGPVKVGVAVSDLFTGMYASASILAALIHRERTGEGQHIDCSLLATTTAMLANQAANWLIGGVRPGRLGNSHPNVVPYSTYAVRDGHVIVAVGNDRQFQRLCRALRDDKLLTDKRFSTCAERVRNRRALDARLGAHLGQVTRDVAVAMLEAANVPCGPINEVPDVFADPQTLERGMVVTQTRDDGAELKTVAFPARLGATPATYRRPPPRLGADTDEVLRSLLHCSSAEIDTLRRDRVIG
jgi:glutaryl-CoA transferase